MRRLTEKFVMSARNLKKIRCLTITAMLIAMALVMDLMNIRIILSDSLRISLTFLTLAMTGMLFGPVPAMIHGAAVDFLGWVIAPTGAYFPGFTITGICAGLIWGLVLYDDKLNIWRALIAKALINVLLNICLNTLWISMLYGNAFFVLLPTRAVKNLIMLPFEVILVYVVGRVVQRIEKRSR